MDFLLTKEKFYDKIFIENKKGEQKTMKKKWDELEKKWNALSIQGKVIRDVWHYTHCVDKKEIYPCVDWFITNKGLHNRLTKAYLRTLKKIGKQERENKR